MNKARCVISAFFLVLVMLARSAEPGYGDVSEGHPLMKERQILVLTNACRMAPLSYRDTYVGNYSILDSTIYPAVAPLYWSPQLNASAYAHALDMGDTCGIMQHPSCNGTAWNVRIAAYYKTSSTIGENIAAGNADPFATMKQWIMDSPQGSTQPAADSSWCTGSRCDGHRYNIMNGQYRELGAGYAYGTNSAAKYHSFWVQDFGGGKTTFTNPIVAGAHFLNESGKTAFWADYWDAAFVAPAEASLMLDGQKISMVPAMGKSARGVYQASSARGAVCRTYYFAFTDGNGKKWRYPELGALVTTGEGNCIAEYIPPESLLVRDGPTSVYPKRRRIQTTVCNGTITLRVFDARFFPRWTEILDSKGRTLFINAWKQVFEPSGAFARGGTILTIVPIQNLPSGCYFLTHHVSGACCIVEKISIVNQ